VKVNTATLGYYQGKPLDLAQTSAVSEQQSDSRDIDMNITNTSSQGRIPEQATTTQQPRTEQTLARMLDRLDMKEGDVRLARLLARVESASQSNTRTLIEINGQRLPVQADSRIPAGDLIRVMRANNELRLMELPQAPQRSALSQALAMKMPFQQSLQTGFNQLLQTAQQAPQAPVRQALTDLMAMLPRQTELSMPARPEGAQPQQTGTGTGIEGAANRVKQWLSQSGAFAEARLATMGHTGNTRAEQPPPTDLKQALLRAATTLLQSERLTPVTPEQTAAHLRQLSPAVSPELLAAGQLQFPASQPAQATPVTAGREPMGVGEALRLLAGMLNRITVNQLHSQVLSAPATPDAPTPQTMVFDLPWITAHGDARTAQLRIEQREEEAEEGSEEQDEKASQWRLSLALDLDGLGPLYFDLTLKQRKLSTQIWAEKSLALSLLESTSEQLADRLRTLDLEVPPIKCHLGKPVQLKTRLSQHLIDERA